VANLEGGEPIRAGLATEGGMKERRMRYRYSVSFESDTLPVETVRGEFEAGGGDSSLRQGAREACAHWPKGRKFRSVVIVVERLETAEATQEADEAA
jgi:hypothetical protein